MIQIVNFNNDKLINKEKLVSKRQKEYLKNRLLNN